MCEGKDSLIINNHPYRVIYAWKMCHKYLENINHAPCGMWVADLL
jgi:hypothetical protein